MMGNYARRSWAALALLAFGAPRVAGAEPLPDYPGVLNVRKFGAKGDGKTDDTRAIRAAILAARSDQGKFFWPESIVYFPAGRYRVTDTLDRRGNDGRYLASMALVGESPETTSIVLPDASPAFRDAAHPKALVFMASGLRGGPPTSGGKDYVNKGEGNDAYGNYVQDLTIDVGRNNPGAIALDYVASNIGAIRHVRLVAGEDSGQAAISMDRKWPGPLLLSDVDVEGFQIGISISHTEYSVTLENLRLRGQRGIAIRNQGNSLAMHDVSIETSGTGLANVGEQSLVVADALSIRLTSPVAVGVRNSGYFTFQGVSVVSANDGKASGPFGSVDHGVFFGDRPLSRFAAGFRLKPRAPSAPFQPPLSQWVSVTDFGARPDSGEDATAGIRRALESGAELVYFPTGRYFVSASLDVPERVRRLAGMFSSLRVLPSRAASFARTSGVLRVATAGSPLTIDRLTVDNVENGKQVGIENVGSREVALRDFVGVGVEIVRGPGGGALYLDDVVGGVFRIAGHEGVWARQLNTEGTGTRISNQGSPLWILGVKVEQNCTVVENESGAETDVLGGLVYLVYPPTDPRPAFINRGTGYLAAAYAESAYRPSAVYDVHVSDVPEQGAPQVLRAAAFPSRGLGRMVPGVVVGGRP
jgi:hypothetical protein